MHTPSDRQHHRRQRVLLKPLTQILQAARVLQPPLISQTVRSLVTEYAHVAIHVLKAGRGRASRK